MLAHRAGLLPPYHTRSSCLPLPTATGQAPPPLPARRPSHPTATSSSSSSSTSPLLSLCHCVSRGRAAATSATRPPATRTDRSEWRRRRAMGIPCRLTGRRGGCLTVVTFIWITPTRSRPGRGHRLWELCLSTLLEGTARGGGQGEYFRLG